MRVGGAICTTGTQFPDVGPVQSMVCAFAPPAKKTAAAKATAASREERSMERIRPTQKNAYSTVNVTLALAQAVTAAA